MFIAVDFDGTIVSHKYPEIGKEKPFAIDTLIKLQEDGHKIILWTVREGDLLDNAVKFCADRGLRFYAINSRYPGEAWSGSGVSRKLVADVYIDDSNLGGIPEWDTIYRMISGKDPSNRRHKRKTALGRLIDRCKRSRRKFNK